jgi:hypothetical protein
MLSPPSFTISSSLTDVYLHRLIACWISHALFNPQRTKFRTLTFSLMLLCAQPLQEAELKEKQERSNAIAAFTAPRKKKSEARKFTLPPGEGFSGAVFLTLLKSRAVFCFVLLETTVCTLRVSFFVFVIHHFIFMLFWKHATVCMFKVAASLNTSHSHAFHVAAIPRCQSS